MLLKLDIKQNVMVMWVVMQLKHLPVFLRWESIGSSFWKFTGKISTDCCFGPFSIIESSCEDNSTSLCTCVLYFSYCIFLCYISVLYFCVWNFRVVFSCFIFVLYFCVIFPCVYFLCVYFLCYILVLNFIMFYLSCCIFRV